MPDPKKTYDEEVKRLLGLKAEDLTAALGELLVRNAMLDAESSKLSTEGDNLKRENQSLKDRLANVDRGKPSEIARLARENEILKGRVGEIEAERGPRRGSAVRYFRPGETFSRPGRVVSNGYVERVKKGNLLIPYATIEYGDPESHCDNPATHGQPGHTCDLQPHTFTVTAAHDPLGAVGTFCYEEEAERMMEAKAAQDEQAERGFAQQVS